MDNLKYGNPSLDIMIDFNRNRNGHQLFSTGKSLTNLPSTLPPSLVQNPSMFPRVDLTKVFEGLDAESIDNAIAELKEQEKNAIFNQDLETAESISQELSEMREKQILMNNLIILEQNQNSFDELKALNEEQIHEFNERWESIMYEMTEESKRIEEEVVQQHVAERERVEEEISRVIPPPTKFSVNVLNSRYKLSQLIKLKKFMEAKELKEELDEEEQRETQVWEVKFFQQLDKRKELLYKKQKAEFESLKVRLEKNINAKLKQRMLEYEKLLQRIQNLQNELIAKQSLQFAKIQSTNSKVLTKYSLNLKNLEERYFDYGEQEEANLEDGNQETPFEYEQHGSSQPVQQTLTKQLNQEEETFGSDSAVRVMRTVPERNEEEEEEDEEEQEIDWNSDAENEQSPIKHNNNTQQSRISEQMSDNYSTEENFVDRHVKKVPNLLLKLQARKSTIFV